MSSFDPWGCAPYLLASLTATDLLGKHWMEPDAAQIGALRMEAWLDSVPG